MYQYSSTPAPSSRLPRSVHVRRSWRLVRSNWLLYIFLLPAVLYLGVFHYGPMYGVQLAFRAFDPSLGIWNSPWVGFVFFQKFFASPRFSLILGNTIWLSLYGLIAGFPMPIFLAFLLHYIPNPRLKRFAQTATYAPHFISTVVMVGMLSSFLSPNSGFVNAIIKALGGKAIYFFGQASLFRHLYVWSDIWQHTGWASIIYIAALSGVSPEYHEAAIIDGANRLQRIWHVDVPHILPTAIILLILSASSIMNVGFEKTYLMQNSLNIKKSEVIATYTYKVGLLQSDFGYSTAVGLFNNVINFILLLIVNKAARAFTSNSLW